MGKSRYIKQTETEEVIVSLREDGIVHVFIKPNAIITVDAQYRMLEAYAKVTDIKRPFVFEAGEFSSITKEARTNAMKLEDDSPSKANAIVVKNLGQRILADYYYKFNKPKTPIKIFKTVENAVKWLLENYPAES